MPEPEFADTLPTGLSEDDYVAACWEALEREEDEDTTVPGDDRYFRQCYQEGWAVWRAVDNLKIPF